MCIFLTQNRENLNPRKLLRIRYCSRWHSNFLLLSFEENKAWFFHVNPLPSRGFIWNIKSYFLWKTMKIYLWMSSAAVVIGALRVKIGCFVNKNYAIKIWKDGHNMFLWEQNRNILREGTPIGRGTPIGHLYDLFLFWRRSTSSNLIPIIVMLCYPFLDIIACFSCLECVNIIFTDSIHWTGVHVRNITVKINTVISSYLSTVE